MRRLRTPVSLLLSIACLSLACSGGGGGDGPVDPGGGALDNVTLSSGSSVSFGKIYLQGMPSPKRVVEYAARVSVGEQIFGDLIVEIDEGGHFIHAPLYPPAPNEGGVVQIQVHGGEEESAPLPLDVDALPEAPGAFEAVVNTLRAHIAQRAEAAGTSFEDLAATSFETVDPALFRLKLAQSYVDSDEDVDLTSLIANEGGFLSADERELLDRIFGYAPLHEVAQLDIDHFAAGKLEPWSPRSQGDLRFVDKRACIDASPDISTPGELSVAMLRSALSNIAIDPNSVPGETLSDLGTVLTVGGVIPGFGVAFGAAGTALAVWQASREYYAGVYPNRFTSLTFDLPKAEYDEDETTPGQWDKVEVTAVSDGFFAERAIANVLTSALGAYVSGAVSSGFANLDFFDDVAMVGLNRGLDGYLEGLGTEIIEFCGGSWTVDITGEPYSTAGVLNRRFDVDVQAREILPADVGADFLVVAAQANKFGGQTIEDSKPVEVKAIEVTLTSTQYVVTNPGETIEITATIQNANSTILTWSQEQGTFEDGLGAQTNDGRTRPLKTPTNPSDYPFDVIVESASRDGLRSSGEPPRQAKVTIRNEARVQITPTFECIAAGETVQFTAEVAGLDEYTVIWSRVEGWGSIDQNGLYQAPPTGTTTDKIKAEVEGHPDAFDYAYVDVGECNCELVLNLSTGLSDSQYASSQVAYLRSYFEPLYFYQFFIVMADEDINVGASIGGSELTPPPAPGETGSYDAGLSIIFGTSDSWVSGGEEGQSSMTVTITEHTADHMVGVFNGEVYKYDSQGGIAASLGVSMTFRAALWDGGGWPCN